MNHLRKLREERGLSQFEIGRVANIYPQKISEFERGHMDLRLNEAKNIAHFLGITLDELAGIPNKGSEKSKR